MNSTIIFTPNEVAAYYKARVPDLKPQGARKQQRGPCPIHNGKKDSFAVDPHTGLWHCHSSCARGGDIVGLEIALTGGTWRNAILALERIVGRALLDRCANRAEQRAMAKRRALLDSCARDASDWRRGLIAELERAKAAAHTHNDEVGLANAASALYRIQHGAAPSIVAAYRDHLARDPRDAGVLIRLAREHDRRAQRITTVIVTMLANTEVIDHAR